MTPSEILPLLDFGAGRPQGIVISTQGKWPDGTGVRPELLSVNEKNGARLWHLGPNACKRYAEVIRSNAALEAGGA